MFTFGCGVSLVIYWLGRDDYPASSSWPGSRACTAVRFIDVRKAPGATGSPARYPVARLCGDDHPCVFMFYRPNFSFEPCRIFDVLDFIEFYIAQLVIDLFDAPNINGLHDVPNLRINRNRTTRAFPRHSFGGGDQ